MKIAIGIFCVGVMVTCIYVFCVAYQYSILMKKNKDVYKKVRDFNEYLPDEDCRSNLGGK